MQRNRVLSSLSEEERKRIRPFLAHVALKKHDVLCSSLAPIANAYFPTSGMITLIAHLPSGSSIELASFGNDALLGVLPCIGIPFAVTDSIVALGGQAFRLPMAQLVEWHLKSDKMRREVHRQIASLLLQANQNILCNAFHPLEQRLCRWLLKAERFAHTPTLQLTHDDIAKVLGARRSTISLAMKRLEDDGLVRCSRGCIVIRNRAALERGSCSCRAAWEALEGKIRAVH